MAYKKRKFISHSSEAGSSGSGLADSVSSADSLPGWSLVPSLCVLMSGRGQGTSEVGGGCFYKDPHPHSGGLYTCDLITSQHHHTGGYDSTHEFRVRGMQSVTFINKLATVKCPKFKHILLFHYHISGNIRRQKLNLFARLNPEVKKSKRIKMWKNRQKWREKLTIWEY